MPRNKGAHVRIYQKERVRAREELERRYGPDLEFDDSLEEIVTGEGAKEEPWHRWLPYRQQFSPELVRRFLAGAELAPGPILDPFSGSGTVVIECARQGLAAMGVDAIAVLVWLTKARLGAVVPPAWELELDVDFRSAYAAAESPAHRVAVLLAASRTVSGDGRPKHAPPPHELIGQMILMMQEDARRPLKSTGSIVVGDARALPLADGVVGGILTSPPYLSRYNYPRIVAPLERLWAGRGGQTTEPQIRAALKTGRRAPRTGAHPVPDAVAEAVKGLQAGGRRADAGVVRAYFEDLGSVLAECRRVLRPYAPLWLVIGGADINREYIPSDLIAAEQAVDAGFALEGLTVARHLRLSGRALGALDAIAPRETIVKLRVPGGP